MYFYIDYENVGVNGLIGVEKLTDADNVRIYLSNNPNMKMETVKKVVQCKSKFNFYKMPDSMKKMNLENALDIILLNDVLRMSESLGDNYAVVVSKDTEFDEIIEEINEKNNFNRIFRVGSIAEGCQPQELIEKSETEKQNITEETSFVIDENALNMLFENELSKYECYKNQIIRIVKNSKSRSQVNNTLTKEIGSAATTVIIKALKPIIKVLPGT